MKCLRRKNHTYLFHAQWKSSAKWGWHTYCNYMQDLIPKENENVTYSI